MVNSDCQIQEYDFDDACHHEKYDNVLIGDGSGTVVSKPAGWCCVLFDKISGSICEIKGCVSHGTNNYAELYPYLHCLYLLNMQSDYISRKVLIISDSEITVKCGNGEYGRNANKGWWSALDFYKQNGFNITFQHVKRNSNTVSSYCDKVAGEMRKMLITSSA